MLLRTLLRAALLTFGAVLPGPGGAPAALSTPAAGPGPIQAIDRAPSRVPFPQSLLLLDVLEGTRRAEPRARRTHYPELWNGSPAFDPESSAALLDLLLSAAQQEHRLMQEMRVLALGRLDQSLPTWPHRRHPPEGVVAEFRGRLRALERLLLATRFQGHELLTGTTPVAFLFQPLPSEAPQRILIENLSTSALGLSGVDIADAAHAAEALDLLDTAIVVVTFARTNFRLDRQEFLEGLPGGGLIEVEQILGRLSELALLASDGHRGGNDRLLLDARFQSDLSRLNALSARAHYEDILSGGRVLLQGPGAVGTTRILELPDILALNIWTDITSVYNAQDAIQLLDAARSYVSEQRAALENAREQLQRGTSHVR